MRGWLARGSRGGVALEFAICWPVIFVMLMGVYDITQALVVWQRMSIATIEMSEMTTAKAGFNYVNAGKAGNTCPQLSTQNNPQNCVANQDLQAILDAVNAYFPDWSSDNSIRYAVSIASVNPLPSPQVIWSIAAGTAANPRPCGSFPAQNGVAATTPLIVVDLTYTYVPTFPLLHLVSPSIPMQQTAYLAPRAGTDSNFVMRQGGACS